MNIQQDMLRVNREAAKLVEQLAGKEISLAQCHELVRKYVLLKFFLKDGEADSDNIIGLAKTSIRKMLKKPELFAKFTASGCQGTKLETERKVFLVMNLEKKLGISFSPEESAAIRTIPQLAEAIFTRKQV